MCVSIRTNKYSVFRRDECTRLEVAYNVAFFGSQLVLRKSIAQLPLLAPARFRVDSPKQCLSMLFRLLQMCAFILTLVYLLFKRKERIYLEVAYNVAVFDPSPQAKNVACRNFLAQCKTLMVKSVILPEESRQSWFARIL